ncbi:bacterio-opsin activator domain-containing protein [Halorussus ruber]|uniref:bacterio-opsin activator domain-containing protein n=1 Tax=Halorussus ruber TaxID=1126238 RepID=UPI001091EE1A|nr:bacterio-opsin activator domain-containing protein [Halorussus ruber]
MGGEARQRDEYLTTAEFERLRRRTETYREDLVVALAGRVGLRASEITRIRPGDLRERQRGGETHYLLAVRESDGGDDAVEGVGDDADSREAYVPSTVAHDLRKFANVNDVGRRELLVDVSARRVQMLVSEVADRTDDLQGVTCRDLRQHFAWRLLAEEGVPPRIVQRVGGWRSLQSLAPYLTEPTTAEVVDAFADSAGRGPPPAGRGRPPAGHTRPVAGNARPPADRARPPADRARPPAEYPGTARQRTRADSHREGGNRGLLAAASELGQALADASTSEDAEQAACDRLADTYRAVWICDQRGETRTSAASGDSETLLEGDEAVPEKALDAAGVLDGDGIADESDDRAPDVRIVAASPDSAPSASSGPSTAGELSDCSLAVTPLRSSETVHGLLVVAHETFSSADRTLLSDAGRRVGRTLTAIARKQLLLADTGVELSFRTTDRGVFLVAASADLGCEFELEGVVPVEDHSLLYFVTASGAAVGDVLERVGASDAVDEARLIRDYGEGALLEFAVSGESIAPMLVERGGTVRDLSVEGGVADVSGVFSRHVDVRRVVEALEEAFPKTNLRSKREVEEPVQSAANVRQTVHDRITERQQSVLRAAYLAGYFEWPRGSTAEELAASMGVSSPTLHNHLRKAQQKVLDAVLDGPDRRVVDGEQH